MRMRTHQSHRPLHYKDKTRSPIHAVIRSTKLSSASRYTVHYTPPRRRSWREDAESPHEMRCVSYRVLRREPLAFRATSCKRFGFEACLVSSIT